MGRRKLLLARVDVIVAKRCWVYIALDLVG
jgi:hypothetical protein